jgi:hypothetical protein
MEEGREEPSGRNVVSVRSIENEPPKIGEGGRKGQYWNSVVKTIDMSSRRFGNIMVASASTKSNCGQTASNGLPVDSRSDSIRKHLECRKRSLQVREDGMDEAARQHGSMCGKLEFTDLTITLL